MKSRSQKFGVVAAAVVVITAGTVGSAQAWATPTTLVIRVDHVDSANQQPFAPYNRLFEYTDFFSRSVTVHQGDTVDFQTQPFSFHVVGLATSETAALQAYPTVTLDLDKDGANIATGSGLPKIIYGPSNFPITNGSTGGGGTIDTNNGKGPPVCGVIAAGQQPCQFRGGDDVEIIGPTPGFNANGPTSVDQDVLITAPPGVYTYFDVLHPGMTGTLRVVPPSDAISTQSQIDQQSATQFQDDQTEALATEKALNSIPEGAGMAGHRSFVIMVGFSAADDHVAIDEMLPNRPFTISRGDTITYVMGDMHSAHNVAFPNDAVNPAPFGFDCGTNSPGYVGIPATFNVPPTTSCLEPGQTLPEFIGDPGSTPSGTMLMDPSQVLDSGVMAGTQFNLHPSMQTWQVVTGSTTASGTYTYQCTIHDWMRNTVTLP